MRNAELYEQDFYRWTQEQVALLREGKWQDLDCVPLDSGAGLRCRLLARGLILAGALIGLFDEDEGGPLHNGRAGAHEGDLDIFDLALTGPS